MTSKFKFFAVAGALSLAVPAAAGAHHSDRDDYKPLDLTGMVQNLGFAQPDVESPAEVTTPRVKVWRKTYVNGGRAGVVGIKISCQPVAGLGCAGTVKLGPSGRLGLQSFQLRDEGPQLVRVKLSRAAIAKLTHQGKLRTTVTITARDDAGNATVTTGDLRLIPRPAL